MQPCADLEVEVILSWREVVGVAGSASEAEEVALADGLPLGARDRGEVGVEGVERLCTAPELERDLNSVIATVADLANASVGDRVNRRADGRGEVPTSRSAGSVSKFSLPRSA
jgi:hypothetical protein